MPIRPALRAALVVSGLTVGCGGTATLREEPTTPTANDTTTNEQPDAVADAPCDTSVEPTTEACCHQRGGAWQAEGGACIVIMVGPFVPPSMNG